MSPNQLAIHIAKLALVADAAKPFEKPSKQADTLARQLNAEHPGIFGENITLKPGSASLATSELSMPQMFEVFRAAGFIAPDATLSSFLEETNAKPSAARIKEIVAVALGMDGKKKPSVADIAKAANERASANGVEGEVFSVATKVSSVEVSEEFIERVVRGEDGREEEAIEDADAAVA